MLTIALVGLICAYGGTVVLFALSFLTKPAPKISIFFLYAAEYLQCFSIRFLLRIQPWLRCRTNFQKIYGFFDRYQTRKVIFVANHRSNLDTFLLISLIPGLRGLAKSSLFYNIFFAPIMFLAGFIPAKKGDLNHFRDGLKKLKTKVLERNRPVLIFPETTRCEKRFSSIGKFSRATFDLALDSKALVVPIYISDTDLIMGRGDLFVNPFHPVQLTMLDPIDPQNFNSASELTLHVWKVLSKVQESQRMLLCS